MSSTRREFLQQAASLTAAAYVGSNGRNAWALQTDSEMKPAGWYDRPMRWAQVAFVDDDPGSYDLNLWLDYFSKCHVDAACLSAGGVTAFYPTELPFHHRSQWLGNKDAFGDFSAGCRKLGMNVVARTDAHACRQDVYDAHPDWIAVDEKGQKRKHPSAEGFWITCALGPYNFDFITKVHQEIVTTYKIDGIFTNRWAGSGMCYCEHCQRNFRDFSGLDLPRTHNPQDPSRKQYIAWNQKRLFELWRIWDSKIKEINPGASYIANAGGGALSDLDMKAIGELAPTLFADRQGRYQTNSAIMPWANGKNAKEYRATLGNKAIVGIFSLAHGGYWRDSVQNKEELQLWTADGIAQGLRPWFVKFGAQITDRRWMPTVRDIYDWHYRSEKYLRNKRNLARIGLVYSQQTALFYGGPNASTKVENPALGFYEALIQARIPFEMVHDQLLDQQSLQHFHTLILPNIAALSSKQCEQLQAFVKNGGGLVATYETSLYNEWGVKREDFGLASLFGASFNGNEAPKVNSYLSLKKDPSTGKYSSLLNDLEDAHRIINGVNRVKTKTAANGNEAPLELIPDFPWLPMEEVYPRPDTMPEAGIFTQSVDKGRVVYFPSDIDRTFWDVLDTDLAKLLRNAILWANNEPPILTAKGSGVLDVAVWEQENSMTVHLVNLTNPMYTKGPAREIFPVGEQSIQVRIPTGRTIKQAHLLVAGKALPYRIDNYFVSVQIPTIAVHEVIAFDFNS